MIDFFPELETDRLLLRPLIAKDIDFIFHHFSDPAVNRYLVDEEPVQTREQAQAIIDFYATPPAKPYNRWVLEYKSDGLPIGTCGFHRWNKDHRRAEIGYDLDKAYWKQGLMTEALEAVLAFGFEEMVLNRIEAMVHPENEASLQLLERFGFVKEGLLRGYYYQNRRYFDHWLLALLKNDWNTRVR